jgi:phosphatidylcholine synthase
MGHSASVGGPMATVANPGHSVSPKSADPKSADPCAATKSQIRRGWYVHVFTGTGIIVGMLALQAVFAHRARDAIFFLLLTQVIDGVDGPMARSVDIVMSVPRIDGYVLDLVIDYVTCVIVPAAFLHQFKLLPAPISLATVGLVVFLSAMWFSRTDMMTEDNWFNGFPATWNLIAPTFFLLNTPKWLNAGVTVFLCVLMMTNVKFPHPVRSEGGRIFTLPLTVAFLLAMSWATLRLPNRSVVGRIGLVAAFAYLAGLCFWKTRHRSPAPVSATAVSP